MKNRKDLQASEELVKSAATEHKAAVADQYPDGFVLGRFSGILGTTAGPLAWNVYGDGARCRARFCRWRAIAANRQVAQANAGLGEGAAFGSGAAGGCGYPFGDSGYSIQRRSWWKRQRSNVDLAGEALNEAQQTISCGHLGQPARIAGRRRSSSRQTINTSARCINIMWQSLSLARALGVAQTNYKDYLGTK